MTDLQKVALVTGANKGIGFEVARQLGVQGIKVYLGARDDARGNEAVDRLKEEGIDATFLKLDLASPISVNDAAIRLAEDDGRLDILVNNAGIMSTADGLLCDTDLQVIKDTFETNFFGTAYVTQQLIPLLRKSSAPRVVNISSGLGSLTLNQDPTWDYASVKLIGYNASKAALNMLTVQLAWELRDTPAKVNSANPNFTNTELLPDTSGGRPVTEGAKIAVALALLPDDGPTGQFFEDDLSTRLPW